jgi:aspartate kinase
LSGTTNSLVAIGDALAKGDKQEAKRIIETLEAHYHTFVKELLKKEATFK